VLVPVNLKEQDAFHLTIEEYLLALISVVEELVSSHTLHILHLRVPACVANHFGNLNSRAWQ
jgi:hypothetical protein